MVIIRKKIILTCILVILLISLSALNTGAAENIVVCDPADNTLYTVSFDDNYVSISSDTYNVSFENANHLYTCDVYGGIFCFLGYTLMENSNNEQAVIYRYDITNGDTDFTAINTKVSLSPYNFAVSQNGDCFFVSRTQNKILYSLSKDSTLKSTTLKGTINQIICHDGKTVNIITSDGLYILENSEIQRISDLSPEVPLVFNNSETLKAYDGKEYSFSEGTLTLALEETPPSHSPEITFENGYCIVPQGITFAKLRDSLGAHKDSFSIFDKNSKEITSGQLGTGMEIRYKSQSFTIIIHGELTSEGNINSRDLKLMMKFITGEQTPDSALSKAADLNRDNVISVKDLVLLSKMY